ncbi:MAG: phospho-N-acetylmuramoyl-pentapeptide-transferase [Selenomonadales bacterium]|jgi:phospho-N-acetylmuramoyl-pentapeptide-transferase|nr:phospho-N-acetylmuramoyl-pentapeptide-transferase [Selenomonadales bacterium]
MQIEFWYIGIAALVASLALGALTLPLLTRLRLGQVIRSDGPQSHLAKKGTPTMGGIIFLAPAVALLWLLGVRMSLDPARIMVISVLTLGFGLVGLTDDALKVVFRRPLGLLAREKLLWQALLTVSAALILHFIGHSTRVMIPFLGLPLELGPLYWALLLVWGMGFSNAVNLTDGVDGLAAGTVALSSLAYIGIGLATNRPEVVLFAVALTGSLLGFLYFNAHPARVFMGDVGSLALGGGLVAMSVLTKTELLLPVIGLVYVWSTLSVILQVTFFRLSHGRRLFRMAPFHHALELRGWSEKRIVGVYYLVGLLCTAVGLLAL